MDPLSIAASSIAVLGAIMGTGRGIHTLLSLRKASAELYMLSNEVEALRGLLLIVHTSLHQIHGSETYLANEEALRLLLNAVKDSVLDLESKIEYQLKRSEDVDRQGLPKVSRAAWLKAGPDIDRMRQRIRDARGNLEAGLLAINVQIRWVLFGFDASFEIRSSNMLPFTKRLM